jgi:hypothetical protein
MGWMVNACSGHFNPGRKTRHPLHMRLSWPRGRSGWAQKILTPPTSVRTSDSPVCSKLLYQLSYPGRVHSRYFDEIEYKLNSSLYRHVLCWRRVFTASTDFPVRVSLKFPWSFTLYTIKWRLVNLWHVSNTWKITWRAPVCTGQPYTANFFLMYFAKLRKSGD